MYSRSLLTNKLCFLFIGAMFLAANSAEAHQFWIEPSSFDPVTSQPIQLRLYVGDAFQGEEFARRIDHVLRFEYYGDSVLLRPVPELPVQHPAGILAEISPGWNTVLYESNASETVLKKSAFLSYLEEEGHGNLHGELLTHWPFGDQRTSESFSRHAKALIYSPQEFEMEHRLIASRRELLKPAGMELELSPGFDPATCKLAKPGEQLFRFQLLFKGEPVEGVPVLAHAPDRAPLKSVTDRDGVVVFQPEVVIGDWLITAVHLERLPNGSVINWRSRWATLRFQIPGRTTGD